MTGRLLSSLLEAIDFWFQMWNGFPGEFQLWVQEILNLSNQASYKKVTQVLFAVKFLRQQTTTLLPNQARSGRAGTGKQVQGSSCLCYWCCSWLLYCACYGFPLLVLFVGIILSLLLVAIADSYLATLGSIVAISGSVSSESNWRVRPFLINCLCFYHVLPFMPLFNQSQLCKILR